MWLKRHTSFAFFFFFWHGRWSASCIISKKYKLESKSQAVLHTHAFTKHMPLLTQARCVAQANVTVIPIESLYIYLTGLSGGSSATSSRWAPGTPTPEPVVPTIGSSDSICCSLEKLDSKALDERRNKERLETPLCVQAYARNGVSWANYSFPTLSPPFVTRHPTSLKMSVVLPWVFTPLCIFYTVPLGMSDFLNGKNA